MQSQASSSTALTMDSLSLVPVVDLIKQVITAASKTFVPGKQLNKALKEQLKQNPNLSEKFGNSESSYLQYKDECFSSYDANRIGGTNFIAAAGPDRSNIDDLIQATLFNPKISIKKIVALGSCLGLLDHHGYEDFCDYFSGYNKKTTYGPYEVEIERTLGDIEKAEQEEQVFPVGIVQSSLSVHNNSESSVVKKLDVTLIPVSDMCSITLSALHNDFRYLPITETDPQKRLEILWQIFQDAQHENVLIHCTSGVGRTGHLILTFEILKEYDRIFASNNPELIAKEIEIILNRIRENRPALVATVNQYTNAIYNAGLLYRYGLEKKLAPNAKVETSPIIQVPSDSNTLDNNEQEVTKARFNFA